MTTSTDQPPPVPGLPFEPMAPPMEPDAIALGTPTLPNGDERWFRLFDLATVRNVSVATLAPVLPAAGLATGAAVVVAPGGGFLIGAMENEGWPQARWLAERGIAAFVLKYRLQPTPPDDAAFRMALNARFTAAAAVAGENRHIGVPGFCVEDGKAAMRLVRDRAAEWRVDPARVGYLGYSAGAMIGLELAKAEADARPAFVGAIYPSMGSVEVAPGAPPLFVAIAADDQLYGRQGYGLAESWRRADRPVELHVWERGGHGYGMGKPGTTSVRTLAAFHAWIDQGGWLGSVGQQGTGV